MSVVAAPYFGAPHSRISVPHPVFQYPCPTISAPITFGRMPTGNRTSGHSSSRYILYVESYQTKGSETHTNQNRHVPHNDSGPFDLRLH